jgi:hypothetical protein
MKTVKRILTVFALLILVLSLTPLSVLAIADPDSPPQVNSVYVYTLTDGGIGIMVEYFLDYAVLPTVADANDTATNAYLVSFMDTDGTTTLRAAQPYVFVDSGYGAGIVWIRFSAAEVATYSIDAVDEALYSVQLSGNPTIPSGWGADPPLTVGTITDWYTTGDPEVLLATQIRVYADELEIAWTTVDLIQASALGNVLTTNGENYFQNVIPGLRVLAPSVFSSSELEPSLEDINYDTVFSAVAASVVGGATLTVSPHTLVVGNNTIDTGATTGNFTITLSNVAYGTITNGTGTIAVSPSTLVGGINTINATGAGTFIVALTQTDLQAQLDSGTTGTGFDTSGAASIFGMTAGVFSTALWLIIGVILIAAAYGGLHKSGAIDYQGQEITGKTAMLLYGVWMIAGVLMGILLAKVMAFLFIGYGAFVGYILFYRGSAGDVGRNVTFMGYMWLIVCLSGGMLQGIVPQASTHLTVDLSSAGTTITVASTEGFRTPGIIVIGNERIAYFDTTATTFVGTTFRPLTRGVTGTTAVAHLSGATVRMPESALINDSLDYNIALISDSAGLMSFVTVPLAVWNIITDFLFLPLSFLGTDLVIITVIWGIIVLGVIITAAVSLMGGRRV